jgi:hypothetical protein
VKQLYNLLNLDSAAVISASIVKLGVRVVSTGICRMIDAANLPEAHIESVAEELLNGEEGCILE